MGNLAQFLLWFLRFYSGIACALSGQVRKRTEERHFFTQYICILWSSLPQDTVMAPGLATFLEEDEAYLQKRKSRSQESQIESTGSEATFLLSAS